MTVQHLGEGGVSISKRDISFEHVGNRGVLKDPREVCGMITKPADIESCLSGVYL